MKNKKLRKKIVALCRQMNASGLNQGTAGNISVRIRNHMLITPSGIPYEELKKSDIVRMKVASDKFVWKGNSKPSTEWHFHRAILLARPDINAIVHTHSTFATVLSMGRESIPACHYMIAAFGGNTVRCAKYETFGTSMLSTRILEAMDERTACLLANHGMVAGGKNLDDAMGSAIELETLSKQYYYAKLSGDMSILPNDEVAIVLEKFKSYGQVEKGEKGNANNSSARVMDSVPGSAKPDDAKKVAKDLTTEKTAPRNTISKKATPHKVTAKKVSAKKVTKKVAKQIAKRSATKKAVSRKVSAKKKLPRNTSAS